MGSLDYNICCKHTLWKGNRLLYVDIRGSEYIYAQTSPRAKCVDKFYHTDKDLNSAECDLH